MLFADLISLSLFAGGFLQTENWNYTREGAAEGYIIPTSTWATVNYNWSWLSGQGFLTSPTPETDIEPLAQISLLGSVQMTNIDQVINIGTSMSGLQIGDMIGYVDWTSSEPYDHQSVIIGWGCPFDYNLPIPAPRCPNDLEIGDDYQATYVEGLVPWIVDHGQTSYLNVPSRQRPYNQHNSYGTLSIDVYQIAIPDLFDISNILV